MTYYNIQPPFDFYTTPKKELKEYFRWFQEVTHLNVPERIQGLTRETLNLVRSW
jgi:hypothetical protein